MEQNDDQIIFNEQETKDTGIESFSVGEMDQVIAELEAHIASSIQLTEKRSAHLHGTPQAVEGWTGYIPDPRTIRILKMANELKDMKEGRNS